MGERGGGGGGSDGGNKSTSLKPILGPIYH